MIPTITEYDALTEARDAVTEQFKDKDVIDRYLQLLTDQQQDLEEMFTDLLQYRGIDEAFGAQLDIIGDIVGQPRELISTDIIPYFAFLDYVSAQSYGDLTDTSLGGYYYSSGDALSGSVLLADEQYRLFIKAKILKNNTRVTPEDILKFTKFVFGASSSCISGEGGGAFTLLIGKELNSFEQALLTYQSTFLDYPSHFIPKPAGVKINYGSYPGTSAFAFIGVSGAKGYGSVYDSGVGGRYAKLY